MMERVGTAFERTVNMIEQRPPKRVLELGTMRWRENDPTHHRGMFPPSCEYVMTDYLDGEDVDIVSDAHDLKEFESGSFDAVFTASTFEHIEHPWVAAGAIHRVLKHGGWAFVATHQTFPVHGYPHDYTRWTDKGLQSLFEWAGFRVETACMTDPCKIIPPERITVWDPSAPAYLGVSVLAWKD